MNIAINRQTNQKMIYYKYSYFYYVILNDYFNDDLLNKTILELSNIFSAQSLTPEQFKEYFYEQQ